MTPKMPVDSFWTDAINVLESVRGEGTVVLGSAGLEAFVTELWPLEFSWAMEGQAFFFCASKDDIHRLAPWLFSAPGPSYWWANEVFVIGSVGHQLPVRLPTPASELHLQSWWHLVAARKLGCVTSRIHAISWRTAPPAVNQRTVTLKILVVGASRMGNVGDDLLADRLGDLLEQTGIADVAFADADIDPLACSGFDVIVAGPGGIVYADREGRAEYRNLVNYLKFAFIAKDHGAAFWLVGVGDQQGLPLVKMPVAVSTFWLAALRLCQLATTRDLGTADLLRSSGVQRVVAAQDLVFDLWKLASVVPAPVQAGAMRVALCGEWYDYERLKQLSDLLCRDSGVEMTGGYDFQVLIFSDDDVSHTSRLRTELDLAGHSVSILDCRDKSIERLCYMLKGYNLLITTRFHAMVLAMLCRVPFVVADRRNGKKHRLAQSLTSDRSFCLIDDATDPHETEGPLMLMSAMAQQRAGYVASPEAVRQLAQLAALHQNVVTETLNQLHQRKMTNTEHLPAPPSELIELIDGQAQVRLCWAASSPESHGFANLGDSLSAVVVGALSGLPVQHTNFDAPGEKLVAVGSIAHTIKGGKAVMWGPGVSIRGGALADHVKVTEYDVRALRGPISASHLAGFGVSVPECYGDPVWLLPSIFDEPIEKKYELGVIPHIQDIDGFSPDSPPKADSMRYIVPPEWSDRVKVINTWHEPTWQGIVAKLRLILSCKRILSQSFHGVVIGETYRIPAVNFRHIPGKPTGLIKISTEAECATDPRIYEFYKAAGVKSFLTYTQRRDSASDWGSIIESIDREWQPINGVDLQPLIDAFPLPLAYDPLREACPNLEPVRAIKF
ncbi:polysaccharide pyruvyl transferase family protein [Polaromonas sp. JS666]|uniref:polysaccharide pyruvyl transferase family protein n=1 Tax=Polaromonas sp. (strain JS666 / ATCC BAA-500) TaxID=296591 RepID=UPI001E59FB80|nr:polysaccharide pyruvyl transferase family protein [Polaromonas sp. JS666]